MKEDGMARNMIFKTVAILMLVLLSAFVVRAGPEERLTYEVVDNGAAIEITGCSQFETGSLVIPEIIDEKPVVAVAQFLKNCQALTSIYLPRTVSRVSARSFSECQGLEAIEIAEDHLFYASKDGVFFDKNYATLILCPPGKSGKYIVPEGVTAIADRAFSGCRNLTNIVLPDSLVSIGDEAFFTCERLESIDLPDALISIGYAAFRDCDALVQVRIPENVSEIGGYAFSWFGFNSRLESIDVAEANEHYRSIDGVLFRKDLTRLIQYPRLKSGPYVIPEGVKHVDVCAFNLCQSLTEILFPSTLESIDSCAFELCEKLEYIRIPALVERIEIDAFKQCYGLESFMVDEANAHYASRDGVLFDKELKQLIQCPAKKTGAYTVPEGVESIAFEAFNECNRLTEIILPDSLVSIGAFAFSGCYGLSNISIPDGVESIGMDAFNGCAGLTNIFIPASVTNVESIGLGAHVAVSEGNNKYTSVDGVLFSKDMTVLHRCPVEQSGTYIIPETVTSIAAEAFANCDQLTNVVFPSSLIEVDRHAFSRCSGLRHIVLPEGIDSIGAGSFGQCTGLESITLPANLKQIGSSAFLWCKELQSISVDSGNLYYAGRDGVLFNREFTELIQYPLGRPGTFTVPGSVTTIGDLAFSGSDLKHIKLSDATQRIGRMAVSHCSGISEMIIPPSVSFLREYAFHDCENMRSAYFLGDAPVVESALPFHEMHPDFTIYYSSKGRGFNEPVWSGYRLQPMHPLALWMVASRRTVFYFVLPLVVIAVATLFRAAMRFFRKPPGMSKSNGPAAGR